MEELDERDGDDDDDFIASDDEEDEDDGDGDNSDSDNDGDNSDDDDQHYTADDIMTTSYLTSTRSERFIREVSRRLDEAPLWYKNIHSKKIDFANDARGLTLEGEATYSDKLMGRRGRENTVSVVAKNVDSFGRGVIQTASGLYSGPRSAVGPRSRTSELNKSYGLTMQGAAIREFMTRMGIPPEDVVSMDDVTFVRKDSSGYALLLATLDFILPKQDCIVEVKCKRSQYAMMRLDMQQEIRNHWGQMQAQMNMVGVSKCILLIYHNGDDPAGKYPSGYSRKMFEYAIVDVDVDFFRNNEREWQAHRYNECLKWVQIKPHPLSSFMDLVIPSAEVPEAFREFVAAMVHTTRNPTMQTIASAVSRKRLRDEDDIREECEKIPEKEIIDWNGVRDEHRDIFPNILGRLDRNALKALHGTLGFNSDQNKSSIVFQPEKINDAKEKISQKFRLEDVESIEMLKSAILWYEWPATDFEEEQKRFLHRVFLGERRRGQNSYPLSKYLLTKTLFRVYQADELVINNVQNQA